MVPTRVRVSHTDVPVSVNESTSGFRVRSDAVTREAVLLTADVETDEPRQVTLDAKLPSGAWPGVRRFGERTIHYRIDESVGGMSSPEDTLLAWETCRGCRVVYHESVTRDAPVDPDFSFAWKVIEHAQDRKSTRLNSSHI